MELWVIDTLALTAALVCMRSLVLWRKGRGPGNASYPPGPKGLPLVGNIFDMPGKDEWETAIQWGKQYGDLVFIQNFGTKYLFVNSYETAVELFEKRGHIHSSRPENTMLKLQGWTDWFAAFMPYGDELRRIRQSLHRFFQQSVIKDHFDVQTRSAYTFLYRLLEDPGAFHEHIKFSAAQSIILVAYGYEVEKNDPYVELVGRGGEANTEAQTFWLVNALPSLRYLPRWFPGAGFHKRAKEGYAISTAIYHEPYDKAKSRIENGTAFPSITSKLIDATISEDGSIVNDEIIPKVAGIAYTAGGDTIVSVLSTFFLAMVLYPEAMRKGQEELDRVLGHDTLPTFEDKSKLPYINAICNECLRWQTVTPLGVAHSSEEDDVYNGYFLPAGTTVFPNVWAMLRNPKVYPEPDKFIPERWLVSEPPPNANKMAFGFGRRICPGRHFAENSVFIGIASTLAVFDIFKAVDKSGMPITPAEEYTSNIVRHPKPFKCKVTPRSDEAAALVRAANAVSN